MREIMLFIGKPMGRSMMISYSPFADDEKLENIHIDLALLV